MARLREQANQSCETLLSNPDTDVNRPDMNNTTPLAAAIVEGFSGVVRVLCADSRTDINARCTRKINSTPLHTACSSGPVETVKILCASKRTDINARDVHGDTALHIAATRGAGDEEIINVLCSDSRIDVNARDSAGLTALHGAAICQSFGSVKALWSRTQTTLRDNLGRSAHELVCQVFLLNEPDFVAQKQSNERQT